MEIRSNNKAKHRSQKLAFGIFRLLSLCIVLILFAILGFIIYKGAGAVSWGVYHVRSYGWDDRRRHLAGYRRYLLSDGRQCAFRFPGGSDEWHLHE